MGPHPPRSADGHVDAVMRVTVSPCVSGAWWPLPVERGSSSARDRRFGSDSIVPWSSIRRNAGLIQGVLLNSQVESCRNSDFLFPGAQKRFPIHFLGF